MKNPITRLFICLSVVISSACSEKEFIASDESLVTSKAATIQNKGRKAEPRNLISKYSFQATTDGKVSREFTLTFSYDEEWNLETIKRTDKHYNSKTGITSSEGFTNWALKYDGKGILSEATSFNNESLKFNSNSVLTYIYENKKLSTINLAVIKDTKQILSLERFKLKYNQEKQLISYKSGNDKGHDFAYKNNQHESSVLKGTSSFDFEYSSDLSPTSSYEDGVKFVIFQALGADPARGFGLVSQNLPTRLVNRTGGVITFESTINEYKFPVRIIEKFSSGNSNVKNITNIEYQQIEE